jgi:hypothetical protein
VASHWAVHLSASSNDGQGQPAHMCLWKVYADFPAVCHPPLFPSLLVQYENLYCVLRGKKIFHLLPPTELYRMSLQRYPAARFEPQVGYGWGLKLSSSACTESRSPALQLTRLCGIADTGSG